MGREPGVRNRVKNRDVKEKDGLKEWERKRVEDLDSTLCCYVDERDGESVIRLGRKDNNIGLCSWPAPLKHAAIGRKELAFFPLKNVFSIHLRHTRRRCR